MVPSTAIHSPPARKRSYIYDLAVYRRCPSNFSPPESEVKISRISARSAELRQLLRTHPVLILLGHSDEYIAICLLSKTAPLPADALEMPDVRDWRGEARSTALYILYTDSNQYAARRVLLICVSLQEISVSGVLWKIFPCCGCFAFSPPFHLHPQNRSRGFSFSVRY